MISNTTIVAPATGSAPAAIAVIRLSGSEAFSIINKVFRSKNKKQKDFSSVKSHTIHYGGIFDNDVMVDEVLVSVFRAPHSYTGEDIVEISSHGSPFIVQKIITLFIANGACAAQPGEFTLRAFLNGKMDLAQAEAVADLIASSSEASHKMALNQMKGGFSAEIKLLRDQLIHFASMLELELDFAEEDVEFANRKQLSDLVQNLKLKIESLIVSFETSNALKKGVPVVIAGKPNSGKSTLLNAIVNEDRAIVSHIEGTTRDTIEEEIVLDGILFRFIDTAGIRQTYDTIESIGVSKTFEKLRKAKVLIYLFDVNTTTPEELKSELESFSHEFENDHPSIIPAGNKTDEAKFDYEKKFAGIENLIFISAKNNTNVSALMNKITEPFKSGLLKAGNFVVTNSRHYDSLIKTNESLQNVIAGLEKNISNDLIASDLRHALNNLGLITGQITTDDLLKNIFERFCIGK